MRKHDVRKWLHAVLDLLPVILIPVFMIYSHRHTIDSGTIEVSQNLVVDFNQYVKNGNFADNSIWQKYLLDDNYVIENNSFKVNDMSFVTPSAQVYQLPFSYLSVGDVYVVKFDLVVNNDYQYYVSLGGANILSASSSGGHIEIRNTAVSASNELSFYISYFSSNTNTIFELSNVNVFNLTKMFGSGNEPTIVQFNQWFDESYYGFTLSHKELIKNYSTIIYDDTDIMSQMTYQLYNSVDKYFNMGNVFNLGGIYDWFNLNIFNGNAPISIFIVWNVVLYEFVMDLLFLLYGLFMWFIDMVEKLMEKPINSVR